MGENMVFLYPAFVWIADDHYDDELKSMYVKGLTYRVRDPNSLLASKVVRWLAEGKVAVAGLALEGALAASNASLEGKGKVS